MLRDLFDPDWQHLGTPYVGVLGSAIPLSGDDGGSVLANEVTLPEDSNDYFRAQIKTAPASGTLFLREDGSGYLSNAAEGTWTLEYYIWKNGALVTTPPGYGVATFQIGISVIPIEVPLNPASETDTAYSITFTKSRLVPPVTERQEAVPITALSGAGISAPITTAVETNTAVTITKKAIYGLTPDDITAIAEAVYAKFVAEGDVAKLNEIWQRLGLDASNPTINRTDGSYAFDNVSVAASEDPSGDITHTRQ